MSNGNLKKMKSDAGFGNVGAVDSEPATTLSPAAETPARPSTTWLGLRPFENWFFWIAADVIYIPLYLSRHLPLTAVLYAVFLGMCLIGVRAWNRSLKKGMA